MIYARISYCINMYIYCTFTVYILSQICFLSLWFSFWFFIFLFSLSHSTIFPYSVFNWLHSRPWPFCAARHRGAAVVPAGGGFFPSKTPKKSFISISFHFHNRKREKNNKCFENHCEISVLLRYIHSNRCQGGEMWKCNRCLTVCGLSDWIW